MYWAAYERGSPSYYNIPAGKKNVGVRRVYICVRKLAANSKNLPFGKNGGGRRTPTPLGHSGAEVACRS
jgi:hypothetical protein